ncbi:Anaerobic nitric oxide reductase transcription regulator NorR [Neomoorella glycerini]|uniref:Anaerobic nitric oxide reductase transcription regulator NorR n=1 Tax=Neomoorella glycerini TaxID=55779 RepID=A0A6I5ZNA4_9FIRM|nr:sigma 54-interacting transcriptional regulator [Moorella glycerini]QGP91372.1 Anaerobic nitric oxide reductase transcription regulator NorR [Moorella glycerini]
MSLKVVVVSWGQLTNVVREIQGQVGGDVQIELVEGLFDQQTTLEMARQIEASGEVDVFVSGGGNARMLRENLTTPVVAVTVSGYDMLKTILQSRTGDETVYFVHFSEIIHELNDLKEVLPFPVYQVALKTLAEGEAFFNEISRQDRPVVIVGASLAWDLAQRHGLKAVYIYSPKAVLEALERAVELARVRRQEMEKTQRIQAILDFTCDGIIACDQGGIITAFNPAAEMITGISSQGAIGRPVQEVVPSLKLEELITSEQAAFNQLEKINDKEVMVNKVPVIVRGEPRGAVATLHDIVTIQKAEYQIRLKARREGLEAKTTFADIVGESLAIKKTIAQARQYARSEATVLIMGETGTGKELFAQAIHNASRRQGQPFVAINCAAVPENLLESELFGYEEGAFTGARKKGKPGLFELAHGGTIFLDEIGDISQAIQIKLLRVLQQREIMRVGGQHTIPIDVRVIAATNRDLLAAVREGTFRADLYYRLNVLPLYLPPLRERKEDIPALLRDMLFKANRTLARYAPVIAREILTHLPAYSWPGNVRELQNIAERIMALTLTGNPDEKQIKEVIDVVIKQSAYEEPFRIRPRDLSPRKGDLKKEIINMEKEVIMEALRQSQGNKTRAAELLGVSRSTLWRKLKE